MRIKFSLIFLASLFVSSCGPATTPNSNNPASLAASSYNESCTQAGSGCARVSWEIGSNALYATSTSAFGGRCLNDPNNAGQTYCEVDCNTDKPDGSPAGVYCNKYNLAGYRKAGNCDGNGTCVLAK